MPLERYGVLKGAAVDARREDGRDSPHYQVRVLARNVHYRIAVNVLSKMSPSELLFLVDDRFQHPITSRLSELTPGFTPLASTPNSGTLDFIRGNLFDCRRMRPLPHNLPGPDNDLSDRVEHYVGRAKREQGAEVYAFGQRWGPERNKRDAIFGFEPGNGIHDIHMNQGNHRSYERDDGVWQDGALVLHFPGSDEWVAIFLAFQSQAWHTDDVTGHAIRDIITPGPAPRPDSTEPDGVVRIVAALVNPSGRDPEREKVTLLNASPDPVDLAGWQIADKLKNKHTLAGTITPCSTVVVTLPPEVQLGNRGGIITLLDARGMKVDGVSYTEQQARREGWPIVF
ncbi:MAG: DUF2278 family protein [Chloroflexota bacterium]|nr:DUF2278 family protein [Chloroflexota bacterium]